MGCKTHTHRTITERCPVQLTEDGLFLIGKVWWHHAVAIFIDLYRPTDTSGKFSFFPTDSIDDNEEDYPSESFPHETS